MRFDKLHSLGAIAATTVALTASLAFAPVAFAETYDTGVDLGPGTTVLAPVTIDQKSVAEAGIAAVIRIREDTLRDTNVKWDDKTVAEYLVENGISQEDYLSPKRSEALENIAVQRAAEMSAAGKMSHTRPNGGSCFSATYGGRSASSEIIAWGVGDIDSAVNLWASEKQAYVDKDPDSVTGHYETLINPAYTAYGFSGTDAYWAGEAGRADESTSYVDVAGDYEVAVNLPSDEVKAGAALDMTSVATGENVKLKASYDGKEIVAKSWKSADEKVFTVDEDGVATGVSVGRAGLTLVTSDDTEISFTFTSGMREMFRLYNPYSGEHFYTANAEERDSVAAAGWEYEGVGWVAPTEGAPVFRVYNPFAGDHHYTTNEAERDKLVSVGWVDEGVGWRSAGEDGVPLWRQYNPNAVAGAHNYTTNEFERDSLVSIGWHDEGIGWYGLTLE